MSRSLATTSLLGLAVLLLMACSSPRKASERACRKAERHMARAVWLCPDMMRLDSALYIMSPVRMEVPVAYSDSINYDSLLSACAALNAALEVRVADTSRAWQSPVVIHSPQMRQVAVRNATTAIRQAACDWKDFTQTFGRLTVTVKNSTAGPLLTVEDAGETVKVPCPPAIGRAPCPEPGVATWYRSFTWTVIGLFALILIGVISWVMRGKWLGP